MSVSDVMGGLAMLLFVAAPVVAAVLVAVSTHGRVRTLGLAGFALFAVVEMVGVAWVWLLPWLTDVVAVPLEALAGGYAVVRGVLTLAAILLLALAVIVDRSRPAPAR